MQEGVKSKPPAVLSEPSSVDGIVRKLTREHEAAAELATGLRELIKENPIVANARQISKAVDTLQVLAGVLASDYDKGGSAGAKTALQDHLTLLKAASSKCAAPREFSSEEAMHKEAFLMCKHLEKTPRLLTEAMNLKFDDLVDLNPAQGASLVANKRSLLQILRGLGQAYCAISIDLKVPGVQPQNFAATKQRIWEWYRRLVPVLWLVWGILLMNADMGIFRYLFTVMFGGMGLVLVSAIGMGMLLRSLKPWMEARYRRRLAALEISPDRDGQYRFAHNGLLLATDYGALQGMLTARGHNWDNFTA